MIKNLLLSVFSLVAYVVPKKRNLWVFGAWFGLKYCDNTRYFFEYASFVDGLDCVWITRSDDIVRNLRAKGYRAYKFDSLIGVWVCMRSAFAFYVCGPKDISEYFVRRSCKVQFWHGVPLKRIMYDDNIKYPDGMHGYLKKALHKFARRFFPAKNQDWNYIISSSPLVSSRLISAFDAPSKRILELGYPRQDYILNKSLASNGRKKKILYAPTHRLEGRGDFKAVNFFEGLDLDRLASVLEKNDAYLLIKLHYFHTAELPQLESLFEDFSRVSVCDADQDIYDILPNVDVLITDYSSVYIDYLCLERPVVFYAFDVEQYEKSERGLYEEYRAAVPGPICDKWDYVIDWMDNMQELERFNASVRSAREKYFPIVDGAASKRLVRFLMKN